VDHQYFVLAFPEILQSNSMAYGTYLRRQVLSQEIACIFQNPKNHYPVGFEVFTAVTMKNAVFWDVAPRRSCVNGHFGKTYRLHLQDRKTRVSWSLAASGVWRHLDLA
jgi:hypothetical protein